ncbi:calcium-binding protein [Antarcticirhabdus aurantiaca]|uniref:Calcium-binding protein n=1 Tax=Antarcticirhabdus aurantiaca TaxID=2606717 RepID=A0ACD4NJC3_9HYPH|nr:calcium-binding protein [Antarcticirhabdus aurantiaca]WAJ26899.1 calcium-binding protein [Jeongeuplla avenae]
MAIERAVRASDLVDTFGVVAPITFTDGVYAPIDKVLSALDYLGIDHVRARAPNPTYALVGQKNLETAADAGLKFVFHPLGKEDPRDVVQNLHAFEDIHPGSIVGIEGLNEVNNFPVSYKGLTGTSAAKVFQSDLYNGVNADALLRSIPVLGFTDWPNTSSASDWSNEHVYPKNGGQPFNAIRDAKARLESLDPNKPFVLTELGYHNSMGADTGGGWEGVDLITQAKLTLNAYMDAASLGSRGTYLYQLLNSPADGSGADQENHFGLFDARYNPKPAATAVHNLTSILQDDDSAASSFISGSLSYTMAGLPPGAKSYLTQKTDGTFQVVLWAEPDIWDEANDKPISAAGQTVTVTFDDVIDSISVFDPLLGTTATKTVQNGRSVSFTLSDHPIVVEIDDVDPTKPGMGNDTYVIDVAGTPITEAAGGGMDTVRTGLARFTLAENLENLIYTGTASFNGKGNGSVNTITGGSAADILDGGRGADILTGGAGNDSYVVDDIGDTIVELAGGGTDKVSSSVDYRLPVNVENLTLVSGAHLDGFGNALANTITGTTRNNVLAGGLGSDRLVGRQGNDAFVFDTALGKTNVDTIVDFGTRSGDDDSIVLDHAIFNNAGAVGTLRKAAFAANQTGIAAERDDRIIYEADTGKLFYDPDGSGAIQGTQFAKLTAGLSLSYADFLII